MEKSGISAIVATVLMIVITVVGVVIIWVAIIPMIKDRFDFVETDVRLNVKTVGGYTVYDIEKEVMIIQIERGADDELMEEMRIIINFGGDSYWEIVPAPKSNNKIKYTFNLSAYEGIPTEVSVSGIVKRGGSDKETSVLSRVDVPQGRLVGEGIAQPFGKQCSTGDTRNCGTATGLCTYGTQECINEAWDICKGGTGPEPEVCDDLDHDCDGADTNGLTCDCTIPGATQPTTCGQGECASTGIETCTDGQWVGDTCIAGTPGTETCNGLDDDCDGMSDNNLNLQPTTCGVGACARTGMETCISGTPGDSCVAGTPGIEVCDAGELDEDCDGTSNLGCACNEGDTQATTCGVGVCARTGIETCTLAGVFAGDTCSEGTPPENPEVSCSDGLDNDCDGLTDGDDSDCDTTAWDVSTASYDNINFSTGTDSRGGFFKPDGTKFYIVGDLKTVYQYSLTTPWDVSTASYDNINYSVNGQEKWPNSIFFKPDGTKFYIIGHLSETVHQYSLTTPWDVSTVSYDSINYYVNKDNSNGLFFKPDGTKFYTISDVYEGTKTVYQYSLTTPWDVSTASYSQRYRVDGQEKYPMDIFFKPDGTKFYMVGHNTDNVYQYSLTAPWSVSTATYDNINYYVGGQEYIPNGLSFKPDGTKFYIIGSASDKVYQYST